MKIKALLLSRLGAISTLIIVAATSCVVVFAAHNTPQKSAHNQAVEGVKANPTDNKSPNADTAKPAQESQAGQSTSQQPKSSQSSTQAQQNIGTTKPPAIQPSPTPEPAQPSVIRYCYYGYCSNYSPNCFDDAGYTRCNYRATSKEQVQDPLPPQQHCDSNGNNCVQADTEPDDQNLPIPSGYCRISSQYGRPNEEFTTHCHA